MRKMLEGLKGEEWVRKKERVEGGKKKIEVVDLCGSSEEGSGVVLMDEWKEEKRAKDRREKDERRKREVEGMVNRGKNRGMSRKGVMEIRRAFGDYEEVVGDVGYVLGIEVGLARCFVMDREISKVVDLMVNGERERERKLGG